MYSDESEHKHQQQQQPKSEINFLSNSMKNCLPSIDNFSLICIKADPYHFSDDVIHSPTTSDIQCTPVTTIKQETDISQTMSTSNVSVLSSSCSQAYQSLCSSGYCSSGDFDPSTYSMTSPRYTRLVTPEPHSTIEQPHDSNTTADVSFPPILCQQNDPSVPYYSSLPIMTSSLTDDFVTSTPIVVNKSESSVFNFQIDQSFAILSYQHHQPPSPTAAVFPCSSVRQNQPSGATTDSSTINSSSEEDGDFLGNILEVLANFESGENKNQSTTPVKPKSKKTKAVRVLKPKVPKFCVVCGKRAKGYNFGAIACDCCKAFFRRNAKLPKDRQPVCFKSGDCAIERQTGENNLICSGCRLAKCFVMGMCKERILSDEEKLERKAKTFENRQKREEKRLLKTSRLTSLLLEADSRYGPSASSQCTARPRQHMMKDLSNALPKKQTQDPDLQIGSKNSQNVPSTNINQTPATYFSHQLIDIQQRLITDIFHDLPSDEFNQRFQQTTSTQILLLSCQPNTSFDISQLIQCGWLQQLSHHKNHALTLSNNIRDVFVDIFNSMSTDLTDESYIQSILSLVSALLLLTSSTALGPLTMNYYTKWENRMFSTFNTLLLQFGSGIDSFHARQKLISHFYSIAQNLYQLSSLFYVSHQF